MGGLEMKALCADETILQKHALKMSGREMYIHTDLCLL